MALIGIMKLVLSIHDQSRSPALHHALGRRPTKGEQAPVTDVTPGVCSRVKGIQKVVKPNQNAGTDLLAVVAKACTLSPMEGRLPLSGALHRACPASRADKIDEYQDSDLPAPESQRVCLLLSWYHACDPSHYINPYSSTAPWPVLSSFLIHYNEFFTQSHTIS